MKYYDTETKGFYEEQTGNRIELTDAYWQTLLEEQSKGRTIREVGGKVFCLLESQTVQNGVVIDISGTDEYKAKIAEKENAAKKIELLAQIDELDKKSIRALREGGIKDDTSGQTWLDYYTQQIAELRQKITGIIQ